MTKLFCIVLGEKVGEVDVDQDSFLGKGCWLVILGWSKVWISFKYERLPEICYVCSCLNHLEKDCECDTEFRMVSRSVMKLFGPSLKADGLKVLFYSFT